MGGGVSGTYVASSSQIAAGQVIYSKLGSDLAIGTRIFYPLVAVDTVVQGTWAFGASAVFLYGYMQNTTNAVNDAFSFFCYLGVGTYTIRMTYTKTSDAAIATIAIDGVTAGTIDTYAAGSSNNNVSEISSVSISSSSLKTVSISALTKNGASSDYWLRINSIEFIRTA